jgi:hypothetical protein
VQQVLQGGVTSVHVSDLDAVIEMLVERREQLVQHEATTSLQLMLLFLQEARWVGHAGATKYRVAAASVVTQPSTHTGQQ